MDPRIEKAGLLKVQVFQEELQGPWGKTIKMREVNVLKVGGSNSGSLVG